MRQYLLQVQAYRPALLPVLVGAGIFFPSTALSGSGAASGEAGFPWWGIFFAVAVAVGLLAWLNGTRRRRERKEREQQEKEKQDAHK